MSDSRDSYSHTRYRHLIAWPARLQREGPLLERVLSAGPVRRVLDLGSGPGDHARFLASRGFAVTGLDASEKMLESAREDGETPNVEFVLGDFRRIPEFVKGTYGGAICLGNALPHITSEEEMRAVAKGLARVLEPGAHFLLQILNYDRVFMDNQRAMPINVAPDPDAPGLEAVLIRVMKPMDDGRVLFFPTSLRLDPDAEEPITVISSKRIELRGWRRTDIAAIFGDEGIVESEALGSFDGAAFDPGSSRDLIWIGRRQ